MATTSIRASAAGRVRLSHHVAALPVAIGLLAFAVRLVPVVLGRGLYGVVDYDDGVYFGSAIALVLGRIPYRDFLLLHPPGILYLLAPFAALGGVIGDGNAFALARIAFMALGGINAALVTLVAGRFGRRPAVLAGLLYAAWPAAVLVERSTWLIAPQSTLILLALLAIVRRRGRPLTVGTTALVGLLLGAAVAIEIWNVLVVAVVVAWIATPLVYPRAVHGPRPAAGLVVRRAAACLVVAGVTAAVACAPFLVASGGSFVRYVVRDQLGRSPASGSLMTRLRAVESLPIGEAERNLSPGPLVVAVFVILLALAAFVAWRRTDIRPLVALAGAQLLVLMLIPPFAHYAAWLAPIAAIVFAVAFVEVAHTIGERRATMPPVVARAARALVVAGYAAALGVFLVISAVRMRPQPVPVAALASIAGSAGCVLTDEPTLTIETGLLRRDLLRGCPQLLDPTGTSYDVDRGNRASRDERPEYQALMAAYYTRGTVVFFHRLRADAFSASTWMRIRHTLPVRTTIRGVTVLRAHR